MDIQIMKPKHLGPEATPASYPRGGRPKVNELPMDKDYFKNYYHLTKKEVLCECGMMINTKVRCRHIKRKIHLSRLEEMAKNNIE